MIEEVGYMPLLKSRAGEFRALRSLTRSQRSQLLPLMDLVPPLWDFEKEAPTRSMDEHASLVSPHLWRSWGPDLPILLDGQNLDTDTAERNPLEQIIEGCRARGIQAIPVTGLDRSQEYQSAVRRSLTRDRRGSCIRLESEDLAAIGRLEAALKDLMESARARPLKCRSPRGSTGDLRGRGGCARQERAHCTRQTLLGAGVALRHLVRLSLPGESGVLTAR